MKVTSVFLLITGVLLAADPSPKPVANKAPLITVFATGAVKKEGRLELPPESRIWDALVQAGGLLPRYQLRHVRLTRKTPEGALQHHALDFREKAASPGNLALRDQDIIHVPENIP